jgi:hypothetical protein
MKQNGRLRQSGVFFWKKIGEIYFWRVAALAIPRSIPPKTSSWSG